MPMSWAVSSCDPSCSALSRDKGDDRLNGRIHFGEASGTTARISAKQEWVVWALSHCQIEPLTNLLLLRRHPLSRALKQHDARNDEQDYDYPKGKIPEIRIHLRPL
jgi:hypothetical protein